MNIEQNPVELKIEAVLDKIRPFLMREGGNVKIDHFDQETGILYVDMIGACAGCIMAESDVSESIEVMVMDEVKEVKKVELIAPSVDHSFDDLLRMLAEQREAEESLKNKGGEDDNTSKGKSEE